MNPSTWKKQPSEKRRLALDATLALITGDTIAVFEAKIFDGTGTDLSATMLAGSSNTDTAVYVWIQDGMDGMTYFLRVRITTALGEVIEDDLEVDVQEKDF
jgi:hypothetical protein